MTLAKRDDFPQPVAKVGGARAWDVEDIRAYAAGEPVSRRRGVRAPARGARQYRGCPASEDDRGYLNSALYYRRTTVPPPDGRVSERHYWLADTVASGSPSTARWAGGPTPVSDPANGPGKARKLRLALKGVPEPPCVRGQGLD